MAGGGLLNGLPHRCGVVERREPPFFQLPAGLDTDGHRLLGHHYLMEIPWVMSIEPLKRQMISAIPACALARGACSPGFGMYALEAGAIWLRRASAERYANRDVPGGLVGMGFVGSAIATFYDMEDCPDPGRRNRRREIPASP